MDEALDKRLKEEFRRGPKRPIVMSEKVTNALVAAGIVTDAQRISRIVIDLQPGMPPVLHVRYFGDERLLDVMETMGGVEIRTAESQT